MSDDAVAALLRSDKRLVVIEAAAGCGKTYQGASYASDVASSLAPGRLLILTHTHAACSVFADRVKGASSTVEIKTIDALVMQVATAYRHALGLPEDLPSWAWRDDGKGFDLMADKVARFVRAQPMVAKALAVRYPVIVCDEHQDSTADQHELVMALHRGGARLRIFGDPLQRIYGGWQEKVVRADWERWNTLKQAASSENLDTPHRWNDGCVELGKWIKAARISLESGQPIDLTGPRPDSLSILVGNNKAQQRTIYQLAKDERRPIDDLVHNSDQLMILAAQNELVAALRAFWMRRVPIWEGHMREALAALVSVLRESANDPVRLAEGVIEFVSSTSVGFSRSTHGNRLLQEIHERCARQTTGKPANIQAIARRVLDHPSHHGVSDSLALILGFIERKEAGFADVKIDRRVEFRDAIRLGSFPDPDEGFAEIARKRSYSRPTPPRRTLSSIHKAKGLECDNVMIMACDRTQFSGSSYSKCKLYVALSRARKSLTLIIPDTNASPFFKLK